MITKLIQQKTIKSNKVKQIAKGSKQSQANVNESNISGVSEVHIAFKYHEIFHFPDVSLGDDSDISLVLKHQEWQHYSELDPVREDPPNMDGYVLAYIYLYLKTNSDRSIFTHGTASQTLKWIFQIS